MRGNDDQTLEERCPERHRHLSLQHLFKIIIKSEYLTLNISHGIYFTGTFFFLKKEPWYKKIRMYSK